MSKRRLSSMSISGDEWAWLDKKAVEGCQTKTTIIRSLIRSAMTKDAKAENKRRRNEHDV